MNSFLFAAGALSSLVMASSSPNQAADLPPAVAETMIGNQIWMKENLAVSTFRDGSAIPEIVSSNDWRVAGKKRKAASSIYGNDRNSLKKFGYLYNYYAIVDPRGLCPTGWRLPSNADWKQLENTIGKKAARALKSSTGWPEGKAGTDQFGFSGLPAGFRTQTGAYFLGNRVAYFWSATVAADDTTTAHMLFDYDDEIFRIQYDKAMGMSLRCIKQK
jgi:uncharacterized protein (TIGR02145 family)